MRVTKFLTVAAASAALLTTPTLAATAPIATDLQAVETTDEDSELFGNQRGGILALILIAAAIAIGVYIVVDDEEDEEPASP